MKMQTILLATTLASISWGGIAHANDAGTSQAVPYHYGMPLHVAKVIALTEPSTLECKVVTAEMKYIDNAVQPVHISNRNF